MYGVGAAHAPRGARLDRQTGWIFIILFFTKLNKELIIFEVYLIGKNRIINYLIII
jgi:hypothetical protein